MLTTLKNLKLIALILLLVLILFVTAQGASGNIDPAFNASVTEGNGYVAETVVQPDGKIIAVGLFQRANSIRHNNIARFNLDGTLDVSFNASGTGANAVINAVSLQSDGKIIVGGNFTVFNGQPVNRLARLNADGSLDGMFTHNLNFAAEIYDVVVQPDGRVLVGGRFNALAGDPTRGSIIRLNSDGTIDLSFNNGGGANGAVRKIVYLTDGKILIGGAFTFYANVERRRIARLNNNGSLDASFNPGTGANGEVRQVVVQPNGKILISGVFDTYGGMSTDGIARLNADGALNTVFMISADPSSLIIVFSLALQPDGKILAGVVDDNNPQTDTRLLRFNVDGTIDASFTAGNTENFLIRDINHQADGKLIISGDFVTYNNQQHLRLTRINLDGTVDSNFNPAVSTTGIVYAIKQQTNGKIVIGGDFEFVNGVRRTAITRLNADGTLDNTFNAGTGIFGDIYTLIIQPNDKIVIGGLFSGDNTFPAYAVARINTDGSFDRNLNNLNNKFISVAYALDLQPDGKIVIGGQIFDNSSNKLPAVRINADGIEDAAFNPPFLPNGVSLSILIQSDDKILVGGNFFAQGTFQRPGMLRLNSNGTLDDGFSAGIINVYAIAQAADNKIYAGGFFEVTVNGVTYRNIARLNQNGSYDLGFSSGTGANNGVRAVKVQPDGKIIIGGFFTSYNGITANRIARINADGSFDQTFNVGSGASGNIFALERQADSKVLAGGQFLDFNGVEKFSLVRLQNQSVNNQTQFDFDGDGRADQAVFRPSNRVWYLLRSTQGFTAVQFGNSTDKITPADFDGDGRTDIAVFRDGVWYWLNSSNGSFNAYQFGVASDIPVPADYTGDGRAELAVYRGGFWYTLNLANNQFQGVQFGIASDKPISADYDGDGKTDIAVVRQAGGVSTWYILGTSRGFYGLQFGTDTDKLVPADYDGDGKADVAVYRNGFWYVLGSTQGFYGVQFGIASDVPVAADYDGDGKADIAVYRDGIWYLLRSQQGFGAVQFGVANDKPIPAAFVP